MTKPTSGSQILLDRLYSVICPICTEAKADGSCGLDRIEECPFRTHLDALVYTAATVQSGRMDDYVDAVRQDICGTCTHREGSVDRCAIRTEGHCALDALLLPALEVVDDFVLDVEKAAGVGCSGA